MLPSGDREINPVNAESRRPNGSALWGGGAVDPKLDPGTPVPGTSRIGTTSMVTLLRFASKCSILVQEPVGYAARANQVVAKGYV